MPREEYPAEYPEHFLTTIWNQKPSNIIDTGKHVRVNLTVDNRQLILILKRGHLQIVPLEEYNESDAACVTYNWTPKTTMHDWELNRPNTLNEYIIPKGKGIGVLVIDCVNSYIKLVRDMTKPHGIHVIWTKWRTTVLEKDAKEVLDGDTWNGYDICYLAGDNGRQRIDIHMDRQALDPWNIVKSVSKRADDSPVPEEYRPSVGDKRNTVESDSDSTNPSPSKRPKTTTVTPDWPRRKLLEKPQKVIAVPPDADNKALSTATAETTTKEIGSFSLDHHRRATRLFVLRAIYYRTKNAIQSRA